MNHWENKYAMQLTVLQGRAPILAPTHSPSFPGEISPVLFTAFANEISGKEEGQGNSLLHNDVQLEQAGVRTQGSGRERKNLANRHEVLLRLALKARFRSGFLFSHGHPGFLCTHKGTPIRRREMWEQMHRGGGVGSAGLLG